MKRFFKSAVNVMAVLLAAAVLFSFAGCEEIKTVKLDFTVYNSKESKFYSDEDATALTVELSRHLAPKTVDAVLAKVNEKYYDDTIFYIDTNYSTQIMIGDLKFVDGQVVQNLKNGKTPTPFGAEFEANGTYGSNLKNEKGSIGLWRSYYASNTDTYKTSNAFDSSMATLYFPTSTISSYDGYFCVFATFDASSAAISAIKAVFDSSDTYTEYVIYFTGEYDANKKDENNGLTFHAVKAEDFVEDKVDDLFTAEGDQLVCYNKKTVKIPVVNGEVYAKIKTATVK